MERGRKYLRVKEIAEALEICENGAYKLVATEIPHRRFGRAIRVAAEDFKRYLEKTVVNK